MLPNCCLDLMSTQVEQTSQETRRVASWSRNGLNHLCQSVRECVCAQFLVYALTTGLLTRPATCDVAWAVHTATSDSAWYGYGFKPSVIIHSMAIAGESNLQ